MVLPTRTGRCPCALYVVVLVLALMTGARTALSDTGTLIHPVSDSPGAPAPPPSEPVASAPSKPDDSKGVWLPAEDYDDRFSDNDGRRYSGRTYTSADFQRLLIVPEVGDSVFVLNLARRTLALLTRKAIQRQGDGVLLAGVPVSVGSFAVDGDEIAFHHGTIDAKIGPQAPLVGEVPLDTVLDRKPDYVAAMTVYTPNDSVVTALAKVGTPVELKIFFGTWCSVCKARLPGLLRTLEDASNPNLQLDLVAVTAEYKAPRDLLTKYNVHITPTVIIFRDGKEIGRLNKKPHPTLEADLARALAGM